MSLIYCINTTPGKQAQNIEKYKGINDQREIKKLYTRKLKIR